MRYTYVGVVFVCFLLFNHLMYAQEQVLEGRLLSSSNNDTPKGVSVLLFDPLGGSSILHFDISDDKGRFQLLVDKEALKGDSLLVRVQSLQYERIDTILTSVELPEDLLIYLNPKRQELEEVVIKARRELYEIRGDTLFFNVEHFMDESDRDLNDLFERLPGLELNRASGKLRFRGRPVDYVLLDGQNIADQDYQDIGKLLHGKDVKGIQALTNYQENPLLKDMQTGQMAINVELKDSLLVKPKMAAQGGAIVGREALGTLNPQLVALKKKHKMTVNVGGTNAGQDLSVYSEVDIDQILHQGEGVKARDFLTPLPQERAVDRSQASRNEQFFQSINYVFKPNNDFRLRLNLAGDLQGITANRVQQQQFLNEELADFSLSQDENTAINHQKWKAKGYSLWSLGDRSSLEFKSTLRRFTQRHHVRQQQLFINDIEERSRRTLTEFGNGLTWTLRPTNNAFLKVRGVWSVLDARHYTQWEQLFLPLDQFIEGQQNLRERENNSIIQVDYIKKAKYGWKLDLGLEAFHRNEQLRMRAFESPFNVSLNGQGADQATFDQQKLQWQLKARKTYKQWSINLNPRLEVNRLDFITGRTTSPVLFAGDFQLAYSLDMLRSISLAYQRMYQSPGQSNVFGVPVLRSIRFLDSMLPHQVLDMIPAHQLKFGFSHASSAAGKPSFSLNATYTLRERSFVNEQLIQPEVTINRWRLSGLSTSNSFFQAKFKTGIDALASSFHVSMMGILSDFLVSQQNQEVNRLENRVWEPEVGLLTDWGDRLQTDVNFGYGLSAFKQPTIGWNQFSSGRLNTALRYRIKRNLSMRIRYQYIRPDFDQSQSVHLLGAEMMYMSPSNKWQVEWLLNNVLNQSDVVRTRFDEVSRTDQQLALVPFSTQIRFSYLFK